MKGRAIWQSCISGIIDCVVMVLVTAMGAGITWVVF